MDPSTYTNAIKPIKHMGDPGNDWICDACGKESSSSDWELVDGDDVRNAVRDPEQFYLVCPKCGGAEVYKEAGHVHWNPKGRK